MPNTASKTQMDFDSSKPLFDESKPPNPRQFIGLLMEHERRIYAYIRTLMGNSSDADDVLQETSMVMWDKFPQFTRLSPAPEETNSGAIGLAPKTPVPDAETATAESGRDAKGAFLAWAFKIAFFIVQNHRRKQGRSKVVFSNALFETIADKTEQMVPQLDQRHEWLRKCMNKLPVSDRDLLRLRYEHESSIESTAQQSGRTIAAIYKALSRMRASLLECVNRGMSLENQP
ncbi:MAG: RNA polymerase sigma-70 factor (ECF subfamily) [Mariniblastus sp.]|jgi:RNA polymerase sigma-70 factor (ECF subfamily)